MSRRMSSGTMFLRVLNLVNVDMACDSIAASSFMFVSHSNNTDIASE